MNTGGLKCGKKGNERDKMRRRKKMTCYGRREGQEREGRKGEGGQERKGRKMTYRFLLCSLDTGGSVESNVLSNLN